MRLIEDIVDHGHGYLDADYLFVHDTANPGATARNHRNLYASGDWAYSVHYVCDWTGDVYHTMPDDCLAWAVGNGNRHGVSLEICHATNQADFDRTWETAVEFCAWYLNARGWTIDRMLSHDDCRRRWGGTDHTDPIGYFSKFGRSWEEFRDEVYAEMQGTPAYEEGEEEMKGIDIPGGTYPVYRVYNPSNGDHHYTSSKAEVDGLIAVGWTSESVGWMAPDTGKVVYRMYNPSHGDHHFTTSFNEAAALEEAGWVYEGANFSSAREGDPNAVSIHRLYKSVPGDPIASDHLLTASDDEKDSLLALPEWSYEGVALYGIEG